MLGNWMIQADNNVIMKTRYLHYKWPISWSQGTFLIKIQPSSRYNPHQDTVPIKMQPHLVLLWVSDSLIPGAIPRQLNLCARVCGSTCQVFYIMQSRAFRRIGLFFTTGHFCSFPRTAVWVLLALCCSVMLLAAQADIAL